MSIIAEARVLPRAILRLGHAAIVAVVANDERDCATSLFCQRTVVVGINIPAGKTRGQVRRLAENTITLIRPGNREANALDLRPL